VRNKGRRHDDLEFKPTKVALIWGWGAGNDFRRQVPRGQGTALWEDEREDNSLNGDVTTKDFGAGLGTEMKLHVGVHDNERYRRYDGYPTALWEKGTMRGGGFRGS